MFGITTAADFHRKVTEDLHVLRDRIDDPGRAMNCILSTYHLHEWVWARWLKSRKPVTIRGIVVRDLNTFKDWLETNCPHFSLIQELANGSKHCLPVHPTQQVKGYGRGPYGVGPYGKPYLLIDLGAAEALNQRYLVASTVLEATVAFWTELLTELGALSESGV